eukprot:1596367-Alexandrium_andersonii.AAC.1
MCKRGGAFTTKRCLSVSAVGAPTPRVPQAPCNLSRLVLEGRNLPGGLGVPAPVTAAEDGPARRASRRVG